MISYLSPTAVARPTPWGIAVNNALGPRRVAQQTSVKIAGKVVRCYDIIKLSWHRLSWHHRKGWLAQVFSFGVRLCLARLSSHFTAPQW
jgi:hypothetical protein